MYVRVYQCLHIVAFGGKLRRCRDERGEPSFYQFNLVAVVDSGCAERG